MSHALTENAANAAFGTPIVVPDNGDDFTASCAVLLTGMQQIDDREQALRLLAGATTGVVVVKSFPLRAVPSTGAQWTFGIANNALWTYQHVLGQSVWFELPELPVGAKLVSVTIRLGGGNPIGLAISTHSALPATMPQIRLWSQTDGVATQLGSTAVDSSANVSAYNAMHSLTVTVNHTILTATSYMLELDGENGANAIIDGCQVAQLYATIQPV